MICQNCKLDFTIDPEDFEFYKKISVPPPTFCWKCRFQRRAAFRNERKPFWNVSAKSGKRIISLYPPNSELTIYDDPEWLADDWDPLSYGRDYDFSRSFFEQLYDLAKVVPRTAQANEGNVQCEFVVNAGWCKNCYLVCNVDHAEDSAYGNDITNGKSCFDNSHTVKCERCYGSFWIRNSYQTHFSTRSIDNTSSWFLFACKGMTNCFGCVNMMNKSYCIYNKPYSKEEYHERIKAMKLNTWRGLQKAKTEAMAFALKFPIAYLNGVFNTDVSGEYVSDSKNVHFGYIVKEARDSKYLQYSNISGGTDDSYDLTVFGMRGVRCYECAVCGLDMAGSKFILESWTEIIDSEYSMFCRTISNCFGCVGLQNKKYCILNKQYSKEDYETLREKIIAKMKADGEYGEFFPIKHSLIPYNVSLAQEHFPLTKEQALEQGYSWYDEPAKEYKITLTADQIPDAIQDVPDTILKEILECIECKKAYRIIEMELAFLRQEKLPIPRQCIDCRHNERIAQRAKAFLYHRQCQCNSLRGETSQYKNFAVHEHGADQCPTEFETAYPESDPRIVYCLKCLYAEVN